MAENEMLISWKDEFTIDLDKSHLAEELKDYISTQHNVKLIFGDKVIHDCKQWIEIQGPHANRSQAKDYIRALCNPVETADLRYPVELEEVIKDSDLRCRVEKQSGVALRYGESGRVSIQGNDPVSVTIAYSMLEDIISQHWDETKEDLSRRPKQASEKLNAELSRLNSENELDMDAEIPSLSNTIKRVILDVLKTNKGTNSSDSLEDYGISIHHADWSRDHSPKESKGQQRLNQASEQPIRTDSTKRGKGRSAGTDDPGKYLKEYALEKGYSEDKVESIFAAYGRDVKFDVFFRALNDMIKIPENRGVSPVKSTKNVTNTQDTGVDNREEEDSTLNLSELRKRNAKRQQLLDAAEVCSAPKGVRLLDKSQAADSAVTGLVDDHVACIDLTEDSSDDEADAGHATHRPPGPGDEMAPSLSRILNDFYSMKQTTAVVPSRLRHIVVDGSNVAMAHGNHKVFSCRGIEIVVRYFLSRGHKEVTVFVPQWRKCAASMENRISDQHLLDDLQKAGYLVFTPSRRIQGKNIVCYDDRYVVKLAQEVDGVIVSNDNYRDLWNERPDWRHIIENRLLMYSFVGDLFMPPDDPLGRNGPSLAEFLRKPLTNAELKQSRHSTGLMRLGQPPHPRLPPVLTSGMGAHGIPSLMNIPRFPSQLWNQVMLGRGRQAAVPWPTDARANRGPDTVDSVHFGGPASASFGWPRTLPMQPQHRQQQQAGEWQQVTRKTPQTFLSRGKPREESATRQLYESLKEVFVDHDDAIRRVLEDNPTEQDLNTLSEYVLNYLASN